MRTVSYSQFARLRLQKFLPKSTKLVKQGGWEWMNGSWCYEGVGFTWLGRLESEPSVTAGLEVHFDEVSAQTARRILTAAGLPLSRGMRLTEVRSRLGKPASTTRFVSDRKTYSFLI